MQATRIHSQTQLVALQQLREQLIQRQASRKQATSVVNKLICYLATCPAALAIQKEKYSGCRSNS